MSHTITNAYRKFVYFSFLPLALLPFGWIIGNALAFNVVLSRPNNDFSILIPFGLSNEKYLAIMLLCISLGGVAIKAFLDNSGNINLWKKALFGLTALCTLIANVIYMMPALSLSEILIFIILPISIALHLVSLRRERLVELFITDDFMNDEDKVVAISDYEIPEPIKISIESNHCSASFRMIKPTYINSYLFSKNGLLKITSYTFLVICFLPLACLAFLSLPLLLNSVASIINPVLFENVTTWSELPAIYLMYLFASIGMTSLMKMLRIHLACKPITKPDRLSITFMYLLGLANLIIMLKLTVSHTTHSLFLLTVLGLPILATIIIGILCSTSIWKRNTISISEYFEMELGESLKTN